MSDGVPLEMEEGQVDRFRIAGGVWIVAAALGAVMTVVFREDAAWYAITLIASAIAAAIGVLLFWRPDSNAVLASTIGGIAWVIVYASLTLVQLDDIQAWTADVFVGVLGAVAAVIAYLAGGSRSASGRAD